MARLPTRPRTSQFLQSVAYAVGNYTGSTPTETSIWRAVRSPTNSRKSRAFLWRILHLGFHCGSWWRHIPGFEDRAVCSHCNVEDSLAHILTACSAPGQEYIWSWVRWTLAKKSIPCPPLSLALVVGINLVKVHDRAGNFRPGATQSLHLIWRLRCTRVIEHDGSDAAWPTRNHVLGAWCDSLDRRLTMDRALAARHVTGKQGVSEALVLATWSGILDREHILPENWILSTGVLVEGGNSFVQCFDAGGR
ncbi:hypothetical protein BDW22DRAFT_1442871 [Trametopsis cervina]|nr:hypothetical protein BDW22DRAFT_1442871 [Trametopsis cervina]